MRRRPQSGRGAAARRRPLALIALAVLLSACAVGPRYQPPQVDAPERFRDDTAGELASFADLPWWEIFRDDDLTALVRAALEGSYDLRAVAARVEQARALVGVTRSELFPQVGYEGGAQRGRTFTGALGNQTFNSFLGAFALAWEIDVWGRIRRATEASLAELMGSEDLRRAVVLSLVADVAQTYFELQELDVELAIARRTVESFEDTLALFTRQFTGGVGSKLGVARAEAALAQTAAAIPELERLIASKENQISVLLGRPPGPIPRRPGLEPSACCPDAPPGLPSELLQRRPDIRRAEQAVIAANARIGVAVANFFPQIGLTSVYGGQSSELEKIFRSSGNIWLIGGSILGPLFQGGALIEAYRASVAGWDEAVQRYRQAILDALAEVSDALVARQKLEEIRIEQARAVEALRESVRLATLRYVGGLASYYEVLEAQQQLFPAENALARTDRDRLIVIVLLYRALGGGWQAEDEPVAIGFWPPGP